MSYLYSLCLSFLNCVVEITNHNWRGRYENESTQQALAITKVQLADFQAWSGAEAARRCCQGRCLGAKAAEAVAATQTSDHKKKKKKKVNGSG